MTAPNTTRLSWLAIALISVGALLRLIYLDADPNYYEWIGYISDEGRWVQTARNVALHGVFPAGAGESHFIVAPVFAAANFAVFQFFAVSILTTRAFTVLCGIVLLVVFWIMMRRIVTPEAAVFGIALLVFQSDLFALSRVAVPEVPSMLLELLVYWILAASRSRSGLVGAGLLTCLAIGMKATTVHLTLVATAIIVCVAPNAVPFRERLRNLAAYWAPLLACVSIGIAGWLALREAPTMRVVRTIGNLLQPSSLYTWVSFPFSGGFAWTFDMWALGLWISLLAVLALNKSWMSPQERTHLAASAIWIGVFVPIMLGFDYFPTRYRIHVLLPMAINLCCGVSLLQRVGPAEIIATIKAKAGWKGMVGRLILVLPSTIFLAPLLMQLATLAGVDPERLVFKLAAIAVCGVFLTAFAHFGRESRRGTSFFLFFPLVSMIGVLLMSAAFDIPFWSETDAPSVIGVRVAFLAATVLLASTVGPLHWKPVIWSRLVIGSAIGIWVWSSAQATSMYAAPQYSIRDSSKDLGDLFSTCTSIAAIRSESIFNNNSLYYETFRDGSLPSCIVTALLPDDPVRRIPEAYDLLKTYYLFVSPEYCEDYPPIQESGCKVQVRAYKRHQT